MSALRTATSSASSAFCGRAQKSLKLALPLRRQASSSRRASTVRVQALFGGGNKSDDDEGQGDRVTLSREEEPEEYWVSESEKKGANPFKDPLAWVGISAIFLPFILLLVAIGTGLVDVSVYR